VFNNLRLRNKINFVLHDQNMLHFHSLNGRQMLHRLGLGARLIGSNKHDSCIHHCCSAEHGGHQDFVARAIDKRKVSDGGSKKNADVGETVIMANRISRIRPPQPVLGHLNPSA
jgi:hypothetical protein